MCAITQGIVCFVGVGYVNNLTHYPCICVCCVFTAIAALLRILTVFFAYEARKWLLMSEAWRLDWAKLVWGRSVWGRL